MTILDKLNDPLVTAIAMGTAHYDIHPGDAIKHATALAQEVIRLRAQTAPLFDGGIRNTDDCIALASALAALGKRVGARGTLVAVSIERDGHSDYGVRGAGPCLEIEGLARRIEHYVNHLWQFAERPPEIPPAGTLKR